MRHNKRNKPYLLRSLLALSLALCAGVAFTGCKTEEEKKASDSGGAPPTTAAQPSTTPGTSSAGGDKIVVGEYGSLTGDQADFGTQTHEGIQLAVDETNAAGGIERDGKKYQIQLEKEDDQSKPALAETAVKRLIDEKNVTAILGEVASSNSLAGGKVCQEKGVPMISPSSTNIAVTKLGDYIFRICFLDSYQAAVVARFAHDVLKANRVAIFTNKGQAYSVGFSDEFKKAFTRYGGQVVASATYSDTDQDFRSPLTALKQANPDAILVPGYYKDAGTIARQARELNYTKPLLGGDGWSAPNLITIGGDGVNGCYFSDHMSIKDPKPVVQNFVKAYTAKYSKAPTSMAALGYDAAKIMFASIKAAKTLDKKDIRDAIAATKNFDGVTGNISINSDRNADKSAVIIKVVNKDFEYATTVPDPEKPLSQ
ncbi:MAG TPA: ABC transporter substrate-binding protein [Chthonomonadaceae bacterium]|nr:ABC transporter substrate-binding protein [Chthonomonadaceae bacterium]